MSTIINIVIFIISVGVLATSGGFATSAAANLTSIPGYNATPKLQDAHRNLTIAAIITWITIAVMIVLIGLLIYYGTAATGGWINWIVYGFLFLSLAATIAIGILSAIAAALIGQVINDNNIMTDNPAYSRAIIAAVLAIIGFVGIVVVLLITIFSGGKKENKTGGTADLQTTVATTVLENPELLAMFI